MSVPRDQFKPIPGLEHKIMATVDCPHFSALAKVSHPDFLATETGRVTGISFDHVEGLPTGASLGVIAGHNTKEGFQPMPTDDTTAHIDSNGDTHVFHSVISGRMPAGTAKTVTFKKPATHAVDDQIKAKVERWADVEPGDVEMKVFSAQNSGGQKKSLAAIPTASALGRLIERNKDNHKFRQSTGEIRRIVDNDEEHIVIDAGNGEKLATGLKEALSPQSVWTRSPLSFRMITDAETVEGTGNHPLNLTARVHREHATEVPYDGSDVSPAALVPVESAGSLEGSSDSLARKVFEHETDVVSIKPEPNAKDGADN